MRPGRPRVGIRAAPPEGLALASELVPRSDAASPSVSDASGPSPSRTPSQIAAWHSPLAQHQRRCLSRTTPCRARRARSASSGSRLRVRSTRKLPLGRFWRAQRRDWTVRTSDVLVEGLQDINVLVAWQSDTRSSVVQIEPSAASSQSATNRCEWDGRTPIRRGVAPPPVPAWRAPPSRDPRPPRC